MVSRRVTSLLVAALILLLPQVASAVVAPTKVYDPPANQWFPFRNASYLAVPEQLDGAPASLQRVREGSGRRHEPEAERQRHGRRHPAASTPAPTR